MIKVEENVPRVYVDESRDFQLICRVCDIFLGFAKETSDKVNYICNIDKVESRLLPYLANSLGFVTSMYIPDNVLRNICRVFPYCIRNKGTVDAVKTMAYAVFSADQDVSLLEVDYTGKEGDADTQYSMTIWTNVSSSNVRYLEEALRFILPTGMKLNIVLYVTEGKTANTTATTKSSVNRIQLPAYALTKNNIAENEDSSGLHPDLSAEEAEDIAYTGWDNPTRFSHTYSKIGYIKIGSGVNANPDNDDDKKIKSGGFKE